MKTLPHPFSPGHTYPLRSKAFSISFSLLGITALVLAALFLIAHTTGLSVPVPARSGPLIAEHFSDYVETRIPSSGTSSFQFTRLEPATLAGNDIQAQSADVAHPQVKRTDHLRTAASATGVTLLIGLAYLLTHIGPGMAGPESLGL